MLKVVAVAMCSMLLVACASTAPPAASTIEPAYDPVALVAQIRAAAGPDDAKELAIRPLRDPMVEGLRNEAARAEREGRYADAAKTLDQVLAESADDPAVLQERAEAALLNRDLDGAERYARQAFSVGAQVGPLCRRHWETVRVVRLERGDTAAALQAQTQRDACKVTAPPRY